MKKSLLAVLALAAVAHAGELTDETFERWRDHVRPGPQETRWREIAWRPTLWDAVQEAQRLDRPILLWAMNGHPLGCT